MRVWWLQRWIVVQDAHLETAGAFRQRLADTPVTDDAERGAKDIGAKQQGWPPGLPTAIAHEALPFHHPAGCRQYQGESKISSRIRKNPGRVAHWNAAPRGSGQSGVIDPD